MLVILASINSITHLILSIITFRPYMIEDLKTYTPLRDAFTSLKQNTLPDSLPLTDLFTTPKYKNMDEILTLVQEKIQNRDTSDAKVVEFPGLLKGGADTSVLFEIMGAPDEMASTSGHTFDHANILKNPVGAYMMPGLSDKRVEFKW
jgi:hypothetical protein